MWIIGDDFVKQTFTQCVLTDNNFEFYIKTQFSLNELSSSKLEQGGGNILSQICNNLIKGINANPLLPKYIVVLIDTDVIKNVAYSNFGLSRIYGIAVEYLVKNFHHIIETHKEVMPEKAKKQDTPIVIWMSPPGHRNCTDNSLRTKFATSLAKTIQKFKNMRLMKIKQWDFNENALVMQTPTGYRYTSRGLLRYWAAVDSAIKFVDYPEVQKFRGGYAGQDHKTTHKLRTPWKKFFW